MNKRQITIFGASGYAGSAVLEESIARNYTVVSATRSGRKLTASTLEIPKKVDYTKIESIEDALKNSQAVIITISSNKGAALATQNIIQAMQRQKLKRLELLTAYGTSARARKQLTAVNKMAVLALKGMFGDMPKQNELVYNSKLDFTIMMPGWITNDKNKEYVAGEFENKSATSKVSRWALAKCMIDNLEFKRYIGEDIYIKNK